MFFGILIGGRNHLMLTDGNSRQKGEPRWQRFHRHSPLRGGSGPPGLNNLGTSDADLTHHALAGVNLNR